MAIGATCYADENGMRPHMMKGRLDTCVQVLGHKAGVGLAGASADSLIRHESLPFVPYGESARQCNCSAGSLAPA